MRNERRAAASGAGWRSNLRPLGRQEAQQQQDTYKATSPQRIAVAACCGCQQAIRMPGGRRALPRHGTVRQRGHGEPRGPLSLSAACAIFCALQHCLDKQRLVILGLAGSSHVGRITASEHAPAAHTVWTQPAWFPSCWPAVAAPISHQAERVDRD